jgi:feruloyl-CoA synthase
VAVVADRGGDGAINLSNALKIPPTADTLVDRLRIWVDRAPERPYLCERGAGGWRALSYRAVWAETESLGRKLLGLGLSADRPLLVIAPNGVDHALIMLAAMRIGVPIVPVSPAYATADSDARLRHVLKLLTPGAIWFEGPAKIADALHAGVGELPILTGAALADRPPTSAAAFDAAAASVTTETIAKFLLTSGSTGQPKAVANTHLMMCSNMDGLALTWPFLTERPPVLVDWLPWNHTFGGNCCFNLVLNFGGTLYIDGGKPLPAAIGRTVENLREIAPTAYFNVPAGYQALLPHLESDPDLARNFFGRLDFLFSAGAAIPAVVRDRLAAAAAAVGCGSVPVIGAWGSTETAPFSTVIYFPVDGAQNIGAPLPGVTIKLAPQDGRLELRVKGPNVLSEYWRQPAATEAAFDADGYFRSGDAGRLADTLRPEAGILFDGRVAENFKLTSGTWVNVGALRLAAIGAGQGLIADAVVTGHDRDEIGLMAFPNIAACRAYLGGDHATPTEADIASHPAIIAAIHDGLAAHNAIQEGGSTRIARFLIMAEPPHAQSGEITDKGYINQRAVLTRRTALVETLYAAGHIVVTPPARERRRIRH